jgi:hypothetical protein
LAVKRRLAKDWACITGKATRKQAKGEKAHGIQWPPLSELRRRFEKKHGKQKWLCPEVKEWQRPTM